MAEAARGARQRVALAFVGEPEVVCAERVAVVELHAFPDLDREDVPAGGPFEGPGLGEPVDALEVRVDVQQLLVEERDEVRVDAGRGAGRLDLGGLRAEGDHDLFRRRGSREQGREGDGRNELCDGDAVHGRWSGLCRERGPQYRQRGRRRTDGRAAGCWRRRVRGCGSATIPLCAARWRDRRARGGSRTYRPGRSAHGVGGQTPDAWRPGR